MERNMPHPKSLAGIDAEWLSRALSIKYPGTVVESVRPGTVISGMATKARFELDYGASGNKHGLPLSMWVKGGFESHSKSTVVANQTEANFYHDLAPMMPAGVCMESYYQGIDPETGEGSVLIEDLLLRDTIFRRQNDPLDMAMTAKALDLQASYHALFWDDPQIKQYKWITTGGSILKDGVVDLFLGLWDAAESLPRFQYVVDSLRDRKQIRNALIRMWENHNATARGLVHGDSHMGNLFFADGGTKPGYLDWQQVMHGSWGIDFAPFLITSVTVDFRRRHERELLSYYLDRLAHYGAQAPTFDEAWLAYRQHAMWTFMWSLNPPVFQPEEICSPCTERACAAIVDLETLKSLGQ